MADLANRAETVEEVVLAFHPEWAPPFYEARELIGSRAPRGVGMRQDGLATRDAPGLRATGFRNSRRGHHDAQCALARRASSLIKSLRRRATIF